MSDEWGPWMSPDVDPTEGRIVQVKGRDDTGSIHVYEGRAVDVDSYGFNIDPIPAVRGLELIEWRERKPRGLIILQELIENLPAPARESEDA